MQKTANYNLKKPESTDPLRVADFNENADIIDAALSSLNTTVGNKASAAEVSSLRQSVSALSAALGSGGKNCRIAFGSYTGTDVFGAANPNVLSPGFCPVFAAIGTDERASKDTNPSLLVRGRSTAQAEYGFESGVDSYLHLTWSDTSVSWYNTYNPAYQNNLSDRTYYYVILGYDK